MPAWAEFRAPREVALRYITRSTIAAGIRFLSPEELKEVLAMPRQGLSPTERHDSRARDRAIYESIKAKLEPSVKGKL
jgi:hypothetical protein